MMTATVKQQVSLQDFYLKKSMVNSTLKECLTRIEIVKKKKSLDTRSFKSSNVSKTKSIKTHSAASMAINILTSIQCLVKQRKKYLKNIPKDDKSLEFVRLLKSLFGIYIENVSMSCRDVRERDEKIRKAFAFSQAIQSEIEAMQSKQRRKKEQFEKELAHKRNLVEKCIQRKNYLQNAYKNMFLQLSHISEWEMKEELDSSKENEHELAQRVKSLNEEYNSLVNNNLVREKKIKSKLGKIEAQLASWISKYDSDIGEKRLEFEDLQDQYQNVLLDIENVEEQLHDINILYRRYKTEEEYEERQKLEEIAWFFLKNRAAFTIQRYWREYRKKKSQQRKGSKDKKNPKKFNERVGSE